MSCRSVNSSFTMVSISASATFCLSMIPSAASSLAFSIVMSRSRFSTDPSSSRMSSSTLFASSMLDLTLSSSLLAVLMAWSQSIMSCSAHSSVLIASCAASYEVWSKLLMLVLLVVRQSYAVSTC